MPLPLPLPLLRFEADGDMAGIGGACDRVARVVVAVAVAVTGGLLTVSWRTAANIWSCTQLERDVAQAQAQAQA
jgi:hypothetical protein